MADQDMYGLPPRDINSSPQANRKLNTGLDSLRNLTKTTKLGAGAMHPKTRSTAFDHNQMIAPGKNHPFGHKQSKASINHEAS